MLGEKIYLKMVKRTLFIEFLNVNTSQYFRHNSEDAGVDIPFPRAYREMITGGTYLIPMGFRALMVEDQTPVAYRIVPRSSIYKTALRMANSEGIIDSSYRGEIYVPVDIVSRINYGWQTDTNMWVEKARDNGLTDVLEGERLFQIVSRDLSPINDVCFVDELPFPNTERGSGGFGSTGKK